MVTGRLTSKRVYQGARGYWPDSKLWIDPSLEPGILQEAQACPRILCGKISWYLVGPAPIIHFNVPQLTGRVRYQIRTQYFCNAEYSNSHNMEGTIP